MNQRRLIATGTALLASALLAACGSMGGKPSTAVELVPTAAITPNPTRGTVTFTALEHGVRVSGEVRGLVPGSEHGFHIHEKGDCGDNGNASGGHFNPTGGTHGKFAAPGSHAGELPSLRADANGMALQRGRPRDLADPGRCQQRGRPRAGGAPRPRRFHDAAGRQLGPAHRLRRDRQALIE
jgi:Cu-Zn family superoxide dismutase